MWHRPIICVLLSSAFLFLGPLQQNCRGWNFDFSQAKNNWYYGHYSQVGPNGFFGPHNIDLSTLGTLLAPANTWVGNSNDIGEIVSGTNAGITQGTIYTDAKLGNDWIWLTGRYTIAPYTANTAPGSFVSVSPGQLSLWAIGINTPVFKLIYGKQEFNWGFGLQFAASRSEEYLIAEQSTPVPSILARLIRVGLLPVTALSWFKPWLWQRWNPNPNREGRTDRFYPEKANPETAFNEQYGLFEDSEEESTPGWPTAKDPFAWAECGDGELVLGLGFYPWDQRATDVPFPLPTFNAQDLSAVNWANYLAYLIYTEADLTIGLGTVRRTLHRGPELQSTLAARINFPTTEVYDTEGWCFLHYDNRELFLKAEVDWFNRVIRFQRSLSGVSSLVPTPPPGAGSPFASQYVESWRYMTEVGYRYGPYVFRYFLAWLPGPDRRHGILIDRQPSIQTVNVSAQGFFQPYSMLLAYFYGGGVNAQTYVNDATIQAAKVNYAIAANLFVESSFLWARRNSKGYGWGYIRPALPTDPEGYGMVNYGMRGDFATLSPAIPDNDLGWEWTVGANWGIAEGWVLSVRFSYWRPGRWFNYACIDRSVPGWNNPSPANNFGINPNRGIDPVVGFEMATTMTY